MHIAEELERRGYRITVLAAFPNRPAGRLYPGYKRCLYSTQAPSSSIRLVRCFATLSSKSDLASRLLENISFGITSSAPLLLGSQPSAIYANTWPIFAMAATAFVAKIRRIPLVISIQDVYPESLVVQGRLASNSVLVAAMRWMDSRISRSADAVIVLSEQHAHLYREDRKVPAKQLHVVPNWGEATALVPDEEGLKLRSEIGIPHDAFLIVYGGNIGAAAGVDGIIEALGFIEEPRRPYLLIAGAGSQLNACRSLAQRVDEKRISFCSPWPQEKTGAVYAAGDLLVLPTRGTQSLVSVPSKLISYMLARRPVLAQALAGTDIATTIQSAGCGWLVEPGDSELLAREIKRIRVLDERELLRLGEAGRSYALQHLTREVCAPRVVAILEQVAANSLRERARRSGAEGT